MAPHIEDRVCIVRRRPKPARSPHAFRCGAAPDNEDDATRVPKRGITRLPACEPVEVDALIAIVEGVDWIAHPDAAAGQRNLLRGYSLHQDRRSVGVAKR